MKSVNLIPASRRDAKRRRKQQTFCAITCGAYGLLLACGIGAAHMLLAADGDSLESRLKSVDGEVSRLNVVTADVLSELTTSRATIEANRTVAEQPDWSILLTLLGATKGDDVVIRSVIIGPSAPGTTPALAAGKAPEVALEVMGIARSQLAVSQHVLRLEQTSLFSKVSLLDTNRESFLEGDAIAFRLQCHFGEAPKHSQAFTGTDAGGIIQ
jgi:hypothetical protein